MHLFKNLLIGILGLSSVYAHAATETGRAQQGSPAHEVALNVKDDPAVRGFVTSKRETDLKEKSKNLNISGDIRFEWQHILEKESGISVRGNHGEDCTGRPVSHNGFDVEANLKVDYSYDDAWAAMHLQFDNSAGVSNVDCCCLEENSCTLDRFHGSGEGGALNLKRAYIGYTIWEGNMGAIDVEVGRRKLYDAFESDIQFLSRFDGVLLHYYDTPECAANWYGKIAGFVVDERVNQYAWVSEVGIENLWDTGFDVKYSFINWSHKGRSRCLRSTNLFGFDFRNSQLYVEYVVDPELISLPIYIYAAGLYNHDAGKFARKFAEFQGKDIHDKHPKKKGLAWYAGVLFGEVRKKGDWSIEIEYQYVEKNSIPFDDQSGICLGNIRSDCCPYSTEFPLTRGYQGWEIEGLYALTDNLSLNCIVNSARSTQSHQHTLSRMELELIYAF
jgi:hypothetical protein